ncbi:MAG: C10 family peptidase [Prevotella sp.]|nr:C10 family peptidase [Prevotella sp.]
MKKTYLFLTSILLLFTVTISAGPVTKSDARKTAQDFFVKKGLSVKGEPFKAPRKNAASQKDDAAYYVFNAAEKGFVIVSGDDRTAPILGYSLTDNFDEAKLPPHIKSWFQHYADEIERLGDIKVPGRRLVNTHAEIAPKLTTKWNQGNPFYLQCPQYNGQYSVTGCVATATAQVMYYHKCPSGTMPSGLDAYTTRRLGISVPALSATSFDWNSMVNEYTSSATTTQKNAVAKLMRYCGQINQMDYSPSASGAYYHVDLYISKFGYAQGARRAFSEDYSISEWDELIYNELVNDRPVLYEGQSTGGGHAFVVDGYKDGLYHVNWGWGGAYDSYFRLTVMEPGGGGIGASSTSDGYSSGQGAVIGLQPASKGSTEQEKYLTGRDMTLEESDGTTWMRTTLFNLTGSNATFEYGMAKLNADLSINTSQIYDKSQRSVASLSGFYSGFGIDDSYGMTAGTTARFVPVSREVGKTTWHKACKGSAYFEVTATNVGGKLTYTYTIQPILNLQGGLSMEGDKFYKDMDLTANAAINNQGGEYVGDLYLYAHTPESDKDTLLSFTGIAMEPNTNETFKFKFTPEEVGTYMLYLTSDYGGTTDRGNDIIAQLSIEVNAPPIELVSYQYGYNGSVLEAMIKNKSDMTYTSAIIAYIYKKEGSSYNFFDWSYAWASNGYLYAGETAQYNISITNAMSAGNEYAIDLRYAKDFASTKTSDFISFSTTFVTVDSNGQTTGIEDIEKDRNTEATDAPYYTIDGVRLMTKPTKKGLYIQNGKKMVIK